MTDKVTIKGLPRSVTRFGMLQCQVEFDEAYFHQISTEDYHNAYDADEKFTLFRADAQFTHRDQSCEVPVFAMKEVKNGEWQWRIRFRPPAAGAWKVTIKGLCWHPHPCSTNPDKAKRTSSDGRTYYQHEFTGAETSFSVEEGDLPGPLESPNQPGDNYHYFYRCRKASDGSFKRRPVFLLGTGRAWNVGDKTTGWEDCLDIERELFSPMHNARCDMLYHWMAPWESQLVHQSQSEFWPKADGSFDGTYNRRLAGPAVTDGYKRYDQGRAAYTDGVFDLADKYQILICLAVMSHQSLEDEGHAWPEKSWRLGAEREPSKLNGFQLFEHPGKTDSKSLGQFFEMDPDPGAEAWKRQLWKHFANFWRYLVGRWTAHPALGAWILIDELEGVGSSTKWWWENKRVTGPGPWHNNLVSLLRGKLRWKWEGQDLSYTGDYLCHPLTVSTTHYEGSSDRFRRPSPPESPEKALEMIDNFGELEYHGTWHATPKGWLRRSQSQEKIDFMSHHAYQGVPTWGQWVGGEPSRRYEGGPSAKGARFTLWRLPNEDCDSNGVAHINTDRWLWDSLCMRLRNWVHAPDEDGKAAIEMPKLVTEYGCRERNFPFQRWDYFGPRNPSFTHFANWASLVLGHAGIPFKWNDKELGEMVGRGHGAWEPSIKYPVNNYVEITNIAKFIHGIAFDELRPTECTVIDTKDVPDLTFNAWALSDSKPSQRGGSRPATTIIVWIYNRQFTGSRPDRLLKIVDVMTEQMYSYSWFNTWDGTDIIEPRDKVTASDSKGVLRIPLVAFPVASDNPKGRQATVSVAAGNDVALRLNAINRV